MKWLEDELRTVLKRKQPPEGFAERVIAKLEATHSRRNLAQRLAGLFRRPALRWVLAAAACLLFAFSLVRYQRQRRLRAEADLASRQATMALGIASAQINMALQQAQQITAQALAATSKR